MMTPSDSGKNRSVACAELEITVGHRTLAEFILEDGKLVIDGIPSDRKPSNINLRTENRLMQ